MASRSLSEKLKVASPCTEDWEAMTGNDRVRFCSHCSKNVNNVSALTRKDVLKLVRKSGGRLCVRYIKHPQTGAPIFADRLYQIGRRAGIAAGVLGASLAVSTATAYAQGGIGFSRSSSRVSSTSAVAEKNREESASNVKKRTAAPGSVAGTVADANGALIPGAIVKISNKSYSRTVSTDDSGFYRVKNLPAGWYRIEISATYFKTLIHELTVPETGETPFDVRLDVKEVSVTVGAVSVSTAEYRTPLVRAVDKKALAKVEALLAGGADVNAREKDHGGLTALFVAIEDGDIKMVELLIRFGADVNAATEEGRTPVMSLTGDATPKLIELLIRHGADFAAVDKAGNNVLHHYAGHEGAENMRALIRTGADLELRNEEGQTPLLVAAYYEDPDSVRALLEAGANFNVRDKEGKTALQLAREEEAEEVVKLLLAGGAIN